MATSYPTLFKFNEKVLKFPSINTVTFNTIVSNEPFAAVVRYLPSTVWSRGRRCQDLAPSRRFFADDRGAFGIGRVVLAGP